VADGGGRASGEAGVAGLWIGTRKGLGFGGVGRWEEGSRGRGSQTLDGEGVDVTSLVLT
jgi:hypothetical protein